MIDSVGARHDLVARQQLLATVDHTTTVDILRPLDDGFGIQSAERLIARLREIDDQD
jgi:hypothetical protein